MHPGWRSNKSADAASQQRCSILAVFVCVTSGVAALIGLLVGLNPNGTDLSPSDIRMRA
jgi:hypothetical protein